MFTYYCLMSRYLIYSENLQKAALVEAGFNAVAAICLRLEFSGSKSFSFFSLFFQIFFLVFPYIKLQY